MSGLPRGWITSSLGAFGEVYCGQSSAASDVNTEGLGTPYVTGPEQWTGSVIELNKWTTTPKRIVPAGCIFITVKGAGVGKMFPGVACAIGRDIYAYEPTQALSYPFVAKALAYTVNAVIREARGDIPGLSKEHITGHVVPLPPLAEQKRIVAKLDALAATSARARADLARLETLVTRYKQAVLSKAFGGELTREWRCRAGLAQPVYGTLEDVLSAPVRNGLSVKGSDTPPGFPALKLSALRGRRVSFSEVRYIPVSERDAQRFLLEVGDILVSRGNGTRELVGIASLVATVPRPTIFPDTAFRIRVDGAKASSPWLASIWNSRQVRAQIEAVAKTTAGIWKISQKDLAAIRIVLPVLEEQHEIVRRIEAAFARMDRLAAEARRALDLLGKLDEAILAKAFRGELVPQDDSDEPAETLLARIRAARAAAPKAKRGRGRASP